MSAIDEGAIQELGAQLESARYERDQLHEGIADACELLGHEGNTIEDLRDALGQIERLLDGKDQADKFEGIAARIQLLKRA